MDFCIYSNIKKQVCETTGISPSEIFSSNNEEVVDARYLLIHLLCDKFTDKEISNMTGISKSLANKIRNTIHVKKNKYSFRCKACDFTQEVRNRFCYKSINVRNATV